MGSMSPFPVTIDGTGFPDLEALLAHVTDRFRRRALRNPGEYHSAEYYMAHTSLGAPDGPRVERALWEVSAILVRTSDDAYVLTGTTAFCGLCRHDPVYEAVLARLDGTDRPFPEMPGDRLRQRFIDVITQHYACRHPTLGPHIRAWLKHTGQHDLAARMLIHANPDDEEPL